MIEISAATGKILALSMLSGVGPATLRKAALISSFETKFIEDLAVEVPAIARAIAGHHALATALEQAEQQVEFAENAGARILSPLDDEYPKLLAATKDDPFVLYVKGSLAPTAEKSVAIIGTREPTSHGETIATRITQFFVEGGWSVVSGLAIGCDAVAHRAALAAKGHTIAVLAHGLQTVAPAQHRKLAEEILDSGGALISQYPFGREVIPQQFAQRDKTQAGLAQGVVMIQSDLKGGSLHASRAALEYGRWLAVPYPTDSDQASRASKIQANLLLAQGSEDQKRELLRRQNGALGTVFILRGRDDYPQMLQRTGPPPLEPSFGQSSMF